ncbi:penicillin-binding protein 2 [Clostridium sp. SHJSY1]|uniref:peptidoglycan D,D-transpeptidase FtsI family protein n=1 Tax=Clostridium sp. SHJSY1 TaxID=2942483 RepID=UPI00287538A5|nr:penicillin-binding protein 2 [Clostridium sp. SHJSY1]MDS0526228.1 penicillin-binding protein 2 [Clostridium sp. SHJSY1]
MNDFRNSVKGVMVVFLFFFVALISYIAYFQAFEAHDLATSNSNGRVIAKKNEVVRGTIYDRNGNVLAASEKVDTANQTRKYTNGELYVHPLGYASKKYGTAELEKVYDDELSTDSTAEGGFKELFKNFSIDSLKKAFQTRDEKEKKIGNGVITTLDPNVQQAAFNALGNRKGAVVALDPKTGEILAMVSKPTYDPNNLETSMAAAVSGSGENSPLINRATIGTYPPGSTFKTITTASALQNISGAKTKVYEDDGSLEVGTQTINNAEGEAPGDKNLEEALVESSNVVYGQIAIDLGNDKLKATAEKFGFNNDIPTEGFQMSQSKFPSHGKADKGLIAQSGFGQGEVVATPMQMALVASTIANDGVMMQPTLVKEVVDKDKKSVKKIETKKYGQVISSSDASTIKGYMKEMVNEKLSGVSGFSGLNAAGKTGTADHTDSSGNLKTPHSWFISFAPADNPKVAVAVIVEDGGFGAKSAAPVAATVMKAALK